MATKLVIVSDPLEFILQKTCTNIPIELMLDIIIVIHTNTVLVGLFCGLWLGTQSFKFQVRKTNS